MPTLMGTKNIDKIRLGDTHKIRRVYAGNDLVYGLPTNMQEVEYIESSGTQWIDTGVSGGSTSGFDITLNTLGTTATAYEQYLAGTAYSNPYKIYFQGGTIAQDHDSTRYLFDNTDSIHNISYNMDGNSQLKVDDQYQETRNSAGWGALSYYVFNAHGEPNLASSMRLYGLKMKTDGALVRNFVPAKAKTASKNLFLNIPSLTDSGIAVKRNSDGSYDIVGTSTVSWSVAIRKFEMIEDSSIIDGETYTLSSFVELPEGLSIRVEVYNGDTWIRTVLPSISQYGRISTDSCNLSGGDRIIYSIVIDGGATVDIHNLKIQLEKSSTATSFEPHYEAGEVGLYDLANNRFYTNAGTGDFVAGLEI